MILRNTLLTIHLLAVIVWLGGGGFQLLIQRRAGRYRDTPAEAPLLRLIAATGPAIAIATLLVAITGALMSWFGEWGFFQVLWLGGKQAIMVGVIFTMLLYEGRFRRLASEINALPPGPGPATPEIRQLLEGVHYPEMLMRGGALVAVALAVWRPS